MVCLRLSDDRRDARRPAQRPNDPRPRDPGAVGGRVLPRRLRRDRRRARALPRDAALRPSAAMAAAGFDLDPRALGPLAYVIVGITFVFVAWSTCVRTVFGPAPAVAQSEAASLFAAIRRSVAVVAGVRPAYARLGLAFGALGFGLLIATLLPWAAFAMSTPCSTRSSRHANRPATSRTSSPEGHGPLRRRHPRSRALTGSLRGLLGERPFRSGRTQPRARARRAMRRTIGPALRATLRRCGP